jgi:glycosyltransferase involved in cell wall biosynthesis
VTVAARKPRLLIVGPLPPPIGGVETFTQAILESKEFAPFDVAHCDTTKRRAKATQGRFDALNFAWALVHFSRLFRAARRFHPDVIYIPVSGTRSGVLRDLALAAIARRTGALVIGHQHAGDIRDVLERGGRFGRTVRAGFAQFDSMLVLGEPWRALFERWGLRCPIGICPSTTRREVFELGAAFTRVPRRDGPARVLYVGQVGRRKGVLDLLAAVKKLRDEGLAVELSVVGPSKLEGELEAARALATELRLDGPVRFTGALNGDALYEQYRTHDLLALPSYNEGLPVVLYEAGAFELPVVSTPVGAVAAVVRDGENGFLVTPGDVEALAGALRRLVTDTELRARFGARLKLDVASYHPDRVSATIVAAVRELLARRGRG